MGFKQTYPYKIIASGMHAYISKFLWAHSRRLNPQTEYGHIYMCRFVACLMATFGIVQCAINIGLIGDVWEKGNPDNCRVGNAPRQRRQRSRFHHFQN